MEDEISEWVKIEYVNMIKNVGESNLVLTALSLSDPSCTEYQCTDCSSVGLQEKVFKSSADSLKGAELRRDSVEEWPQEIQKKIVLLDPKASQELTPEDAQSFDYLLFGGILGDDPPRDRTGILRNMGFATRHLGPVQMTTDTAVIVANQVVTFQRPLHSIHFIDHPEVYLSKRESITLPFRFVSSKDERLGFRDQKDTSLTLQEQPILAPGLKEHLKKQNNESIF